MARVITIGETMAAMVPQSSGPLRYVTDYGLRIAGAEGNIAVGLAKLGIDAAWVSRLGKDEMGHFVMNQTRSEGVDCKSVIFDSEHRTGMMLKETSAGETRVYYYRENSAASHLRPEDFKEEDFQKAELYVFTGITPVLSDSCRAAVDRGIELAKKHGMLVAFDPNIRKKLWGTKDYIPLTKDYMLQSDIILMGKDEGATVFGTDDVNAMLDVLFAEGQAKYVAIKDGGNGAIVADATQRLEIPAHPCRCIEPIGAGDGFNAGFLAGILWGKDLRTAGEMGAIVGALATEVIGDVEGYPDYDRLMDILENKSVTYR